MQKLHHRGLVVAWLDPLMPEVVKSQSAETVTLLQCDPAQSGEQLQGHIGFEARAGTEKQFRGLFQHADHGFFQFFGKDLVWVFWVRALTFQSMWRTSSPAVYSRTSLNSMPRPLRMAWW